MGNKTVTVESAKGVGVVTLNRPEARNALNNELMLSLGRELHVLEADPEIGAIIVTGGNDIFSAGADIKEMKSRTFAEAYLENFVTDGWEPILKCRKPIIAAVSGYAIGGGCEIALSCDIIVADESARFGQPEVTVGTIPGGGGTQRLARSIGRHRAMELCLTGRQMDAEEADRLGIVSKLVPKGFALEAAKIMAERIAGYSRPIVYMIKESINRSYETSLSEGLHFERRMLHATFALEDQKEAMRAFSEGGVPIYKNS